MVWGSDSRLPENIIDRPQITQPNMGLIHSNDYVVCDAVFMLAWTYIPLLYRVSEKLIFTQFYMECFRYIYAIA